MTNNFEQIKGLLDFDSEDVFYFIQIIQRRKDNPELKNAARVMKDYYIDSVEYFEKKESEIIKYCNDNNARATIRLNKRSYKKCAFAMLSKIANHLENGQYKPVKNAFSSVAGSNHSDKDKTWIMDIDPEDLEDPAFSLGKLENEISEIMPVGDKVVAVIPSKAGFHFITRPFNLQVFRKLYPKMDVHKDSPTNLYIP